MEGVLTWMESSAFNRMILDHAWVFPTLETLHFIGLILLIGSLYVIDLRFMGFASRIPLNAVIRFIPVSLIGFTINLTTGSMFLFADPFRYYPNLAFRLKMLAVLLAGLNVICFKIATNLETLSSDDYAEPRITVRWIAGIVG